MTARRVSATDRQAEQDEAREYLRAWFVGIDPSVEVYDVRDTPEEALRTVWGQVRGVNRDGDSWTIALLIVRDGSIVNISHHVARILGWPRAREGNAVRVGGGRMNMIFHAVSSLALAIWPDVGPRAAYALRDETLS